MSEGDVHRKFEVSSLETKIKHCPDGATCDHSKKPTLTTGGYLEGMKNSIEVYFPIDIVYFYRCLELSVKEH